MEVKGWGRVTLTNGATSTTVFHLAAGPLSVITLSPETADAATEDWWITQGVREFTINHSNAATTRTFGFLIAGGDWRSS